MPKHLPYSSVTLRHVTESPVRQPLRSTGSPQIQVSLGEAIPAVPHTSVGMSAPDKRNVHNEATPNKGQRGVVGRT